LNHKDDRSLLRFYDRAVSGDWEPYFTKMRDFSSSVTTSGRYKAQSHVESLKLALFLPTRSSLAEDGAVTFVVTDKCKSVFGVFAPLVAPSVQQTNHSELIEY